MPKLEVYLFGRFCILRNGKVLEGVEARKVQELFSYLFLHRKDSLSREALASTLWPETTTAQSKRYLRKTLWQLQSILGCQTEPIHNRLLQIQTERVQINSQADLWCDVAVFEQAFASGQKIPGSALNVSQAKALQHAVELAQKPLLEDWYDDWCLRERERLQTMYLMALDKLMEYCEVHHDYELGLFYGMHSMYHERTRESTHRRLMRLHYLSGDRASALRQYEHCVAILDEEFGIEPSKQTIVLYRNILSDQLEDLHVQDMPGTMSERTNLSLPNVFDSLIELKDFLTDLQYQVQQHIQQVTPLLRGSQEMPASSQDVSRHTHSANI